MRIHFAAVLFARNLLASLLRRIFSTRTWCACTALVAVVVAPIPDTARAADFALRDDDRVVFLGDALIEREPAYGYWETAITAGVPQRRVIFRNLGWSGDTPFGEARSGFDTTAEGFERLREGVVRLAPTVVVVGYGANDAYAGAAGLPNFVQGMHALLDALSPTEARFVILSPLKQEDLGAPLPSPAAHNADLALYRDALRQIADQRGHHFIDLYGWLEAYRQAPDAPPLTDDGVHLTAYGYWRLMEPILEGLGVGCEPWSVEMNADGAVVAAHATRVDVGRAANGSLTFETNDARLPLPPAPGDSAGVVKAQMPVRNLRIAGLSPGRYSLAIDGRPVATVSAEELAKGVAIRSGPEFEQTESLRETIRAKNQLYFYRWRPQNETYLFGFRKHEQGNNAREVPMFDPLVEQQEELIASMRAPATHRYEIRRVGQNP